MSKRALLLGLVLLVVAAKRAALKAAPTFKQTAGSASSPRRTTHPKNAMLAPTASRWLPRSARESPSPSKVCSRRAGTAIQTLELPHPHRDAPVERVEPLEKVRISGTAFAPQTAYHVRDVIIDVASAVKL